MFTGTPARCSSVAVFATWMTLKSSSGAVSRRTLRGSSTALGTNLLSSGWRHTSVRAYQ